MRLVLLVVVGVAVAVRPLLVKEVLRPAKMWTNKGRVMGRQAQMIPTAGSTKASIVVVALYPIFWKMEVSVFLAELELYRRCKEAFHG